MLPRTELFMRILQVVRFLNSDLWREERRRGDLVRAKIRLGHDLAGRAHIVPVERPLLQHISWVIIVGELCARLVALP